MYIYIYIEALVACNVRSIPVSFWMCLRTVHPLFVEAYFATLDVDVYESAALFHLLDNGDGEAGVCSVLLGCKVVGVLRVQQI